MDLVARYGGEEFAAILIDTAEAGALEVAERVRAGITRTQFGADTLSVSIGVATCPKDATFKDELVDKADWAMYLAKRRGRDKVMTFSADARRRDAGAGRRGPPGPRRRDGRTGGRARGLSAAAALGGRPDRARRGAARSACRRTTSTRPSRPPRPARPTADTRRRQDRRPRGDLSDARDRAPLPGPHLGGRGARRAPRVPALGGEAELARAFEQVLAR